MRVKLAFVLMAVAASQTDAAFAACSGQLVTRTGPTGLTLQTCNDGKYATCVRDGQRLGFRNVKGYCDDLRAKGQVK
jgi:hypothetical protein